MLSIDQVLNHEKLFLFKNKYFKNIKLKTSSIAFSSFSSSISFSSNTVLFFISKVCPMWAASSRSLSFSSSNDVTASMSWYAFVMLVSLLPPNTVGFVCCWRFLLYVFFIVYNVSLIKTLKIILYRVLLSIELLRSMYKHNKL